jgi:hypothetical protein
LIPPQISLVSNEVPEHPCVSLSSNCVFERRLIEKYIAENGVDPITNEVLTEEQLIDIKGILSEPYFITLYFSHNLIRYSCFFRECFGEAKTTIGNKYSSYIEVLAR